MLTSALIYQPQINENVDLLEMAPQEDTPAVEKMIAYSQEFEGGQVGMILVKSDIAAEPEFLTPRGIIKLRKDPFKNLYKIENLSDMVNNVDSTTAVSIAFLMKSVGASLNFSGSNTIAEFCEPMPDVPKRRYAISYSLRNTMRVRPSGQC